MKKLPSYESLNRPLPFWHPKALYFGLARLFLTTVGKLSQGVQIGLTYGFDSGVMLEYVYRDRPSGMTFLGKWLDSLFLNSQGWQGIRQRGEILKGVLRETLQENVAQGKTTILLDVACGGGRYDLEVIADFSPEAIQARLRDYKPENVEKAKELAEGLGLNATIEIGDAFNDEQLAQVIPRPNLIIVSGLHEILPDNQLISHHFVQLFSILESQGVLIFTVQPYHPQLELIARVLNSHTGKPWVMRLRSVELVQEWAIAAGFKGFDIKMDSFGIFGVVKTHKS